MIFASTMAFKGLLSFILIAVFTRMLSAASYGDYAIVIAVITFADVFGFMWLRTAVMRHIGDEEQKDDNSYFTNAMAIYAVIALLVLLISWLLSLAHVIDVRIYNVIGLIIAAEAISNMAILLARLRLRLGIFVSLNILKPLLALGIGIALIASGMDVQGAVYGLLASCAFVSIIGLSALKDFRSIALSFVDMKVIKAILIFGLPFVAIFSIQSAIKVTDRVLLETIIGGDVTGLFSAAQDIPTKLIVLLVSAIHMAGYPMIVKALETKDEDACREQLQSYLALLMLALIALPLSIILFSSLIATIFLGEEFRPFATQYFGIFAGIAALGCLIQYYTVLAFDLAKQTYKMILPFAIALIINAGVGYALIPSMAEQGAIWGSLLAYVSLLLSTLVMGRSSFALPLLPKVVKR
jgi:O-antigen/teichoic acid export membrane protein